MVNRPFDRRPLRVDGDRMQHQAEYAVAVGQGAQLLVREIAWVVVDRAAARVSNADRPLICREALVEEPRGCMRQIEHNLALREYREERAAEARGALRQRRRRRTDCACSTSARPSADPAPRRGRSPRARNRTARRPRVRASVPPAHHSRPGRGRLESARPRHARRSRAQRDGTRSPVQAPHEAFPRAAGKAARRSGRSAGRRRRPRSQGQPRSREHVRLAESVLTVRELHEQVVVGIGDHGAYYPLSDGLAEDDYPGPRAG